MNRFLRTLACDTGTGGRANGKETMALRRYQEGSLFTRGKGSRKVWVARWREDVVKPDTIIQRRNRSRVLGPVNSLSRRQAFDLLNSLRRSEGQKLQEAQVSMTFGEFARKWEEAVLPTYRSSTRYFYRTVLHDHLVPQFALHRLRDIATPDVQIFINQKAKRYAPAVLHHIRATISRTYQTAKSWGYVDSNPALGVCLPQKRAVLPKITFEPSQVMKILEHLEEPHRTMVSVAAVTGLRASELFGLKWSDVDFDKRLLFIRRTFYRGEFGLPKTKSSERVVPLSSGLATALERHQKSQKLLPLNLVFPNAVGKPYESANLLKRILHPTLKTLNLPKAGWRVFRRSVATALSEMREPVRTAQQVLGHASAQTTLAYYIQSVEESQRSAVTRLEERMLPPAG